MTDAPAQSSASALAEAIGTFLEEHRDDDAMAELVELFEGALEKVGEFVSDEPELSPGQRSAREDDEPEAKEEPAAEAKDDRDPPKSFSEASGRAKERFAKTSPSTEGKTPDARGRDAATASGDREAVPA